MHEPQNFTLIYPMAAMIALTFTVLIKLFRGRVRAVRDGTGRAAYFKTYRDGAEPEYSAQAARHFSNLFEAPVLFYAACLTGMVIQSAVAAVYVLAWLYVAARIVHAFVHLGRNKLMPRIWSYFTSWLVLLSMWLCLIVDVAMRRGL